MIKKTDFVNLIFEAVRLSGGQLQPSEILNLMNLFTTAFDEVIQYEDFLRLMHKVADGSAGGVMLEHHQRYMDARDALHQQQDIDGREQILARMKPQQKEVAERLRGALRGQPLEDALRRVSQTAA
jgi:hypothetical protein